MFKFDFDVEEDDLDPSAADIFGAPSSQTSPRTRQSTQPPKERGASDGPSDIDFLDAPSDLVPGVYEGGLKTWECSLDLVHCIASIHGDGLAGWLRGKRVVEVIGLRNCRPSLYLLHSIFSSGPPQGDGIEVTVHLQDYNEMVLRLVTLPNIVLAWSDLLPPFQTCPQLPHPFRPLTSSRPEHTGELAFKPALLAAFRASLAAHHVSLSFFSGGWASFDVGAAAGPYDLVLTSETIYRPESLPSLVALLRRATATGAALEDATRLLSLKDHDDRGKEMSALAGAPCLCLVAAKLVYFGVGGGMNEFVRAIEAEGGAKGKVTTIWETDRG
ncbi:uncharacterized protein BXZ73DRAFT_90292 [Epithele typhae]|uniref:uncharacterized protein n=1 Tax=Epithele typhae TaxID=378194 RepID=UPI0020075F6E|nr:uncharacterized protein BXZ73DRAFT_90292 [Epithele typhae]KAH9930475.1 hypothetical protein BXZ73DRAFT_90292 [Epithele typhae]